MTFENGAWWIHDLGSTNGTYMNNERVSRARVHAGDRLAFGDSVIAIAAAADSAPASLARWAIVAAVLALATAGAVVYVWSSGRPVSFERIAAAASDSVYVLEVLEKDRATIVGTGFLVDRQGTLATNAHVADRLRRSAVAVRGDSYEKVEIRRVILHPRWTAGSFANDVALVELSAGSLAEPLRLADAAELDQLRRGAELAAFGFPAASTDPARPRGRMSVDVLADLQPPYLGVNLDVAPGMSGSPVFNTRGVVVGIVVAGDFGRPAGAAANWAISVRVLEDLIAVSK